MIAEIDPRGYDIEGRITLLPTKRSMFLRPTAAMGSFLTSELEVHCESLSEVRSFLRGCRYVSDLAQFGVPDYWMNPRDFERVRKGDCEDFALWAWRQLLALGFDARFVVGRAGYRGLGHAWVTFEDSGHHRLLEPTAAHFKKLSKLATLLYQPLASVSSENRRPVYHQHESREYKPTTRETLAIAAEWIPLFLYRSASAMLRSPYYLLRRAMNLAGTR